MQEISLNSSFAELLNNHGVATTERAGFLETNLSLGSKFRARSLYQDINGNVSSQMDVSMALPNGTEIFESFGDFGIDLETAINNNYNNFCKSSLHQLLALSGSTHPSVIDDFDIEEWQLNGKKWKVYLGNLVPKTNTNQISPPQQFFDTILNGIESQTLNNKLHWFRGYYLQYEDSIYQTEFLMDNLFVENPSMLQIPIMPGVDYYSCRIFIILEQLD